MERQPVETKPVQVFKGDEFKSSKDILVCEGPLEVRINRGGATKPLGILLRTAGDDVDLVYGWLLGEGIIESAEAILKHSATEDVITLVLDDALVSSDGLAGRRFAISSSCGLCGRETLDGLQIPSRLNLSDGRWLSAELLNALPSRLLSAQKLFRGTGGLHASALFTASGKLVGIREDVGRHNALDKLVGHLLRDGMLPVNKSVLMLSGRISYELVQKAAFAGIPAIAGLGAPSTMAVDAARSAGLTLIGFLTDSSFNAYTGAWRLLPK